MDVYDRLFPWLSRLVMNMLPDGRICPLVNGSKRMGRMLIGTLMSIFDFGVLAKMDIVFGQEELDTRIINFHHHYRSSQNTNPNEWRIGTRGAVSIMMMMMTMMMIIRQVLP